MEVKGVLAGVVLSVLMTWPAAAQLPPVSPAVADVPLIGSILDQGEELGLSAAQAAALQRLGTDYLREMTRRQADLMLARLDLEDLLLQDSEKAVDIASVETKLREMERIRTDMAVALLRLIEAGRAELTPDQRAKVTTLAAGGPPGPISSPGPTADPPDPPIPGGARGPAPRASGPPPPGRVPPRSPGGHAPPPPHHPTIHGGFAFGFWAPFWWEPYWWDYSAPPVIVQPPPGYIPPPAPTYWYYCSSASAYYPYVSSCPEAWIVVPATPQ